MCFARVAVYLGSARVSRVGVGVSPTRTFLRSAPRFRSWKRSRKIISAERRNQHARRVRYPNLLHPAKGRPRLMLIADLTDGAHEFAEVFAVARGVIERIEPRIHRRFG